MKNWLLRFWDYSGTQDFAFKYIFPLVATFMTWGFFGSLYLSKIEKSELVSITGVVNNIKIGTIPRYSIYTPGSAYHLLFIYLSNNSEPFIISEKLNMRYDLLQEQIKVGDNITVYIRNKLQSSLTWGRSNYIYKIDMGKDIILDIKYMKYWSKRDMEYSGIFGLVLWSLYGYHMVKRGRHRAAANKT